MQCGRCSHEDTTLNLVRVTLKKEKFQVIIKNVPAEVCEICGETIFSPRIQENMMELARNVVFEKGLPVHPARQTRATATGSIPKRADLAPEA